MMKIALSGMEACVTPMLHSLNGISEADAVLRLWERFLEFEVKRGGSSDGSSMARAGAAVAASTPAKITTRRRSAVMARAAPDGVARPRW